MTALLTETATSARVAEAYDALGVVIDPELDEPITDLGFVRSVEVDDIAGDRGSVEVHLRLPTSFCAPNFAYLMAADAKDALEALPWTTTVVVERDDHHDSDLINRGLAADAGYRGTFAHEADESLDELRTTFVRKAHTAAMERCLTDLMRTRPELDEADLGVVVLADLPDGAGTRSLLRRRAALGLPDDGAALVLVDHRGMGYPRDAVPLAVRRARSTRISIEGNAHFCRGLLATRYPDEPTFVPVADLFRPADEHPDRHPDQHPEENKA